MRTDPKTVKKHFKQSMATYSKNAVVQKFTAEKMIEKLEDMYFPSVLELGAGTGILTEILAQKCTFDEFLANDLVEKSKNYINKFVPDVKFFAGDFRKLNFNKKFDMIISNAVFQWCEDLEKVFDICKSILNKNGILAFSTFSPENFKEIKSLTGVALKYYTLEEIRNLLDNNFEIIMAEEFEQKLKFDNPLKILKQMKDTGVNSVTNDNWGIKDVKNFCENYRLKYPELTLTYAPIIVLAKLK
jgi:malonyl-ACP O-methyltransferase BioC